MWQRARVETFLGQGLVSCDGRVLEFFGSRENENGRLHLAALDRVDIGTARGQGYLQVHTVWRTTPLLLSFPNEQRETAEAFVAHVTEARQTMMG